MIEVWQKFQQKKITQNNRGLFAKKDLKQFQTIMQLEPLAMVVLSKMKSKVCNYCLQQKQLSRCSQCKVFYYCSAQCQKSDWIVHKEQCKCYIKLMADQKVSPLKDIHSEFALNLRCWIICNKNPLIKEKIMSMISLQEYQTPQKLQYFQQMSVLLINCVGIERNQSNLMNMMGLANRISINTFTIQDPLYSYDGLAIGLYQPANLINHDCEANSTQIFDGRNLKIMANQPILASDEITILYTNALDSFQTRKQFLKTQYLFQCFCSLCQVQKMLGETFYFLCPHCKTKNIKPCQGEKDPYVCENCKEFFSSEAIKSIKQNINHLIQKIQTSNHYETCKKSFFSLKKIMDFSQPIFAKLVSHLYFLALGEAQTTQSLKLYSQAQVLLRQEFLQMKSWYRMNEEQELNILFIWKYAQMGKLAYNLKQIQVAYDFTEKAITLAKKINYRIKFKQLKELQLRFSQLKIQISVAKANVFRS